MVVERNSPRILLVLDSLVAGGAERSTVDVLPLLRERGFDPELATLHDRPGLQPEVRKAGVSLFELSPHRGRLGWFAQLRQLIGERAPDLVHTSLFEADVCGRSAAAARRVPVVSTLATERYGQAHLSAPHLNRLKVRAGQVLDIGTARLARRLHAVSEHVADSMATHLRYPRDRIDVVPRGRPVSMATEGLDDRGVTRAELGLGSSPVVLAVARHEQAKGLDRALRAWPAVTSNLPDAKLLIAGRDGGHTEELHGLVDGLGLGASVRFLGHRSDVGQLLAASDAFVLPSRREGLPGSLLEAMAAGTPAVAASIPQVQEVVTECEARLVDAGDAGALAAAIVETLTKQDSARRRAAKAQRRFLDEFTLDRAADGIADFYRRSIEAPRQPSTTVSSSSSGGW